MNYCLVDFPALTPAKVVHFEGCQSLCQKFFEMGIRKGIPICVVGHLLFSKNVLVIVDNESLVLREAEARCLEVCPFI